jgi:vacuolar-type H+-ATPase subunit H
VRPVSTILDRFRRAAAVPAAVGDELVNELAPLFLALDSIEEESARVPEAAAEAAERRLASARAEAVELTTQARAQAESARAETEAMRRAKREAEARQLLAVAEAEAREVREQGAARVPELVAEVLACVRGAGE